MSNFLEIKNLDKAEKMLRDIPQGFERAVTRAINTSLSKVKTEIKKKVSKEYNIKSKDLNKDLTVKKATFSKLTGTISARYPREPIIRFLASAVEAKPKVRIRKNAKMKILSGKPNYVGAPFMAFLENGHIGIFQKKSRERKKVTKGKNEGKRHLPIAQLYTISIAEMIGSETVSEYVMQEGQKYVENVLEKEVNKILLGY